MTNDFGVDIGGLKKNKDTSADAIRKVDRAGEKHGFTSREAKKTRGRPKSPRTGQVHAKVLPGVDKSIAKEARRRGVQQGVLIEEA